MRSMLDTITGHSLFKIVDFTFHIVIFWHVVAHVCKAGKRFHRWIHKPLAKALHRIAPRFANRLYRKKEDARFARENAYMEHK